MRVSASLVAVVGLLLLATSAVATYPLFYDHNGFEVNLNNVGDMGVFDLRSVYVPAYLIKPYMPRPVTESEYLLYYGCIPDAFNNCIQRVNSANYIHVGVFNPQNLSVYVVVDRALKCRESVGVVDMSQCVDDIGVNITSYEWVYVVSDKRGNLNV